MELILGESGMVGSYTQWCSGVTSYNVQETMWSQGFTEVCYMQASSLTSAASLQVLITLF